MPLREAVERLRSRYRLHAVVLFGSRARGDHGPWSDYDLLIVADFDSPYLDRLGEVMELLEGLGPVEPHPYTLEEALSMLRRGCPTLVDALEEGVTLFEGPGLSVLRDTYESMRRRGMRRTNTSIVLPRGG